MKFRSLVTHLSFAAIAATSGALAQEVTLKVSHFLPAGSPVQQKVFQPWCEALKAESKGRMVCQIYPAMQLGGTPSQLVDQAKNGVADVVWTAPGYSSGRFPRIEAFELPFMIADPISGSRAVWAFYEKYAQPEFAAYKVLAFHVDGGQATHTSSKQIINPADWKGLKLRASTRLGTKTVTALGAAPVAMAPAQLTEAISKGVVDGAMGAWELVVPLKLDEITKFHAQPPKGQPFPSATVLMVLMNKEKYESLPADLKAIVDKTTGPAMVTKLGETFDASNEASRKAVLARGNIITDYSPETMAAMRAATASVETEWIAQVSEKGIDGKTLAAAAREISGAK